MHQQRRGPGQVYGRAWNVIMTFEAETLVIAVVCGGSSILADVDVSLADLAEPQVLLPIRLRAERPHQVGRRRVGAAGSSVSIRVFATYLARADLWRGNIRPTLTTQENSGCLQLGSHAGRVRLR